MEDSGLPCKLSERKPGSAAKESILFSRLFEASSDCRLVRVEGTTSLLFNDREPRRSSCSLVSPPRSCRLLLKDVNSSMRRFGSLVKKVRLVGPIQPKPSS